ncbi:zinc ribbon domain-containing protein [Thorsellia anophelis]
MSKRQLAYKLAWQGGYLIAVSLKNTNRTCSCCSHISRKSLNISAFQMR